MMLIIFRKQIFKLLNRKKVIHAQRDTLYIKKCFTHLVFSINQIFRLFHFDTLLLLMLYFHVSLQYDMYSCQYSINDSK